MYTIPKVINLVLIFIIIDLYLNKISRIHIKIYNNHIVVLIQNFKRIIYNYYYH